jgi:selenide,water dikinase
VPISSPASDISLTRLSHGAGCACKIGAQQLGEIRAAIPEQTDPSLLIGLDPADDAAVYLLTPDLALVQTIDFFTPIVDDPYDFGRIAAANAISDIYAMGATPRVALNVLAFSLDSLGTEILTAILQGGAAIASEAGISIAGGHSIDDPEPKYGLAVSGTVDPSMVVTKAGALPGDLLFLSKPIGAGLVTTAAKRGLAGDGIVEEAISVMTTLNRETSERARQAEVRAMTDVTGFGLLGHLHEICVASGVAAELDAAAVPAITGVMEFAEDPRCQAGGSRRNADHASEFTTWAPSLTSGSKRLLSDAMTSGGLLVAVPEDQRVSAPGVCIGRMCKGDPGAIRVS